MRESRQLRAARPIRSSGNLTVNGPARLWPGGGESPVTSGSCGQCGGSGCPACVWDAGPGNGFAVGGSHFNVSYGWGPIGPNGPTKGNWPGQLPQTYWSQGGRGGDMVAAITRCTQMIVNPIIDTMWRVRRYNDPEITPGLPTWIYAPMMAGKIQGPGQAIYPAGKRLDSRSFWATALTQAIWWGRSAFVYQEDSSGQPKAGTLLLMNPFLLSVDETGHWLIDAYGQEPLRTDHDGGFVLGGIQWRLKVMRGLPPNGGGDDDFMGGVLIRHAKAFSVATHIQGYSDEIFHSGVPSGILSVTTANLTPQQAQRLRDDWEQAHGDRRGVAVLNSSVAYNPVMWNPVETDVAAVRRASMQDVAWAFGLSSATALDIADNSMTYANISSRNLQLVQETLRGWASVLMETFTTILPAGQRLEVDWADYTAPTWAEQAPVVESLVASGLLTPSEGRERLGYPPIPEADVTPFSSTQDDTQEVPDVAQ
ncbi:MAG: hypothetical protein RLZ55_167 [Actinomycetota bacterium]